MHKYHCLNPIASVGLDLFSDDYQKVEDLKDAEAVLVRSAAMHDLELPEGLAAVARAGAGVALGAAAAGAGAAFAPPVLTAFSTSLFTTRPFGPEQHATSM